MARRPKTTAPASATVEELRHPADVTRRNIPTAETQALMASEEAAPKPMLYPRNPDLDPQLVWHGKDAQDAEPLTVPTVPIYIQEKVLPAALIRDLQRVSKQGAEPQADLFGGFDRIADPETKTEFYAHAENWSNRMILGDSLLVMNSLAEKEGLRGQVQCIYFDPPYGIRFASNWQPSTRSRDVKEGKVEGISNEPEVVKAFRDTWKDGIHSYLAYLRDRLVVARELLAESGSIFVQIGDENVHRVRVLVDEVFGSANFIAEIFVQKTSGASMEYLDRTKDVVLFYAKDRDLLKYHQTFKRKEYRDFSYEYKFVWNDGEIQRLSATEIREREITDDCSQTFAVKPLTSQTGASTSQYAYNWRGRSYLSGRRNWATPIQGMNRLSRAGRIEVRAKSIGFVRYLRDFLVVPITNTWEDTETGSFTDEKTYVVQTGAKIVERCIHLATDPGDLVLDPTCGSGTTAYVSEQWGRRWITIDTSRVALALARTRLTAARHTAYLLRDSREGAAKESEVAGHLPMDGTFTYDIRQGFVLKRVPHVTLKSIANNAEIDVIHAKFQPTIEDASAVLNVALGTAYEEWKIPRTLPDDASQAARTAHAAFWQARQKRQAEIDASIARNADTEYLHDRPYTKKNTVRVTGPFTVESLSPHRVLPTDEDDVAILDALAAETGEPVPERHRLRTPAVETDFATAVLDNLRQAGVQNTRKDERLTFATLKPWPGGRTISAEGEYEENNVVKRAAIVIGPEYGTVGPDLVREAAREARDLFDTLVICGFAFDPHVGEGTMNLGRLTVLKARMNQELHAADAYKSGGGNLFVVFGEPDIALTRDADGQCRVEIKGVDIFDPTSGEVRASGDVKQDIACWFLDTDYDGDSFFVRHAYFLGGKDPFEKLKAALRADIDEDAWASLYQTESRPFPPPKSGRVAVKVINHHGDEAMRVFTV